MFPAESLWGTLAAWSQRQPKHPAATAFRSACDFAQCLAYCIRQAGSLPGATASWRDTAKLRDFAVLEEARSCWYQDALLLSTPPIRLPSHEDAVSLGARTMLHLHILYCRLLQARNDGSRSYGALWTEAVTQHLQHSARERPPQGAARRRGRAGAAGAVEDGGLLELSEAEHYALLVRFGMGRAPVSSPTSWERQLMLAATRFEALELGCVDVGPLTLRPGDWFLCRPGPGEEMTSLWFGHVVRILNHRGPDGHGRAILEARWHECSVIDALYRMPVVPAVPSPHACGPMWLCEDVVPVRCWAQVLADHNLRGKLCMVAQSWSFLWRLFRVRC
jgi:hypothetical protein